MTCGRFRVCGALGLGMVLLKGKGSLGSFGNTRLCWGECGRAGALGSGTGEPADLVKTKGGSGSFGNTQLGCVGGVVVRRVWMAHRPARVVSYEVIMPLFPR